MTSTTASVADSAPSDSNTNATSSQPNISAQERKEEHYLNLFKAVLHSCLTCAEAGIDEVLDKAFTMADAIYQRIFKNQDASDGSTPSAQTGGAVPDGMQRDPSHPNLDPALPQKLPDQPSTDAPVDPVAASKPADDKPAPDKPADDKPADDKPAGDANPSNEPAASPAADKPAEPPAPSSPSVGVPADHPPAPAASTPSATDAASDAPKEDKPV